jgi:hypothetical protein
MMLGRRDAIPATVGRVQPSPCSQRHTGHCYNHSGAVRHAGAGRRHAYHCTHTDRLQQLPRAFLKTPRPTTKPLPSKLPLFGYKIRHDDQIVARTVKAAAYSAVLHTILPHVVK